MLGTSIGNYQITAKIGEGGMGAVYRAVHSSLGRSAAVKVLLPEFSHNRDMVARFFNEAKAATAIRHSGIVEIYDFGFLPDQSAYIIMELLDGESLAARIRRDRRLDPARALQIIRSVARALHAAHEQGIVHRDLKPDNIFLVPDPEMPTGERVKLLDFGVAKLALAPDSGETPRTRTGAVMGTPMYMAPEQCRGAGTVDRRADLYALGCILYELLCGRPPFLAEGTGDIIAHHLYFQPDPPSKHEPRIPEAVEMLVLKLLQKEPGFRPPTANHLAEAIDALAIPERTGRTPPHMMATAYAPTAPPVTTTLSEASSSIIPSGVAPPRRRWPLAVGAVLFLGAGAAALAIAMSGSDPAPEPDTTQARAVPSPDAAPPPPPPAVDAAPMVVVDAAPAPAPSIDAAVARAPRKERDRKKTSAAPPPPPAGPPPRDEPEKPDPDCKKSAFASILQAQAPDEKTVQAALTRLRGCKASLPADVYSDIQRQLIQKL
jgi:eukaryotic-like serine/threonine-protein kinase